MGGDHAPGVVVEGAVDAARELGLKVVLVGQEDIVRRELATRGGTGLVEVCHASEVVAMDEPPAAAIRRKRDSSIRVGLKLVAQGDAQAFVSAGNTGAVMGSAALVLKRLEGVDRPAILTPFPTVRGDPSILLDAGANVDCKPTQLYQFAVMGSVYAQGILGRPNPSVGLLSNGEEEGKGNELTRETDKLLRDAPIRYIGYVEGRDLFNGKVDVVVCDGFVGNVALKACEGVAEAAGTLLREKIESSWRAKLGLLLAKPVLKDLVSTFDYRDTGGAPLLGVAKVCVISHGSSTPRAIRNAIRQAEVYHRQDVNARIEAKLEQAVLRVAEAPPPEEPEDKRLWTQLTRRLRKSRKPEPEPDRSEPEAPAARVALLFPGQGSEYVGMGKALAGAHPIVTETLAEASEAAGFDVAEVCFQGPSERLHSTEIAQPAILALSISVARLLEQELAIRPVALVGHGVGEFSALVQADALPFLDAVRLVRDRGRLMQEAVPNGDGAMAAIVGLDRDSVEALCGEAAQSDILQIASENAPEHAVISGHASAVERALELARKAQARRALLLPSTSPLHSGLLEPVSTPVGELLARAGIRAPAVPVISSAHGRPFTTVEDIRAGLELQLMHPVRWSEALGHLREAAVDVAIESGPGSFLAGTVRRIAPRIQNLAADDPEGFDAVVEQLQGAVSPAKSAS